MPLTCEVLGIPELLRHGHAIAAIMFCGVHAGVGHPNNVLRGKSMSREAGHTKASGDCVLREHGVLCQPKSKAFCERTGLLHARFRH